MHAEYVMLNAIICVWNEEDIIASCVSNALAQGCDNVFLLDNASTDRTVQQAIRAGAVYHATFYTDEFDEAQKTVYINKCVLGINEQLPGDKNWWLYIDADEFPDFDTGKTIKETLHELSPEVRVVGSHVCNHVPTHEPYFVQGLHPVDFMPVGKLEKDKVWKFNLLRHDKGCPPIYSRSGSHTYNGNGSEVIESDDTLILHHFNHRRPEVTKRRLKALVEPNKEGKRRVDWLDRMSKVDGKECSFYHRRLEETNKVYIENRYKNFKTEKLSYNFPKVVRWYDPFYLKLDGHKTKNADAFIWQGTHAYFMNDFDSALLRFNDALEMTAEEFKRGLLLLKMAMCYMNLGDQMYLTIMDILKRSPEARVRALVPHLGLVGNNIGLPRVNYPPPFAEKG